VGTAHSTDAAIACNSDQTGGELCPDGMMAHIRGQNCICASPKKAPPSTYQRGGYRPKGMVNRGSGRIDPSSPEGLPVDDVPAILGRGEFVIQKNAVDAVGEDFLNKINNIGLYNNKPKFQRGQLSHLGSRYQRGGSSNDNTYRSGVVRNMVTSKNAGHNHTYQVDSNGNGMAYEAYHPKNNEVYHSHEIRNWKVLSAKSQCYPNCKRAYGVQGAPPHIHVISKNYNVNPDPVTSHPHCQETEQGFECPPGYMAAVMRDGTCNCVWNKQGEGWEH